MKNLDLTIQKNLKKKPVNLSKNTIFAAEELYKLYKAGKVFIENSCEVRRECDVYLAACKFADEIGKDLVRHVGGESSGHCSYQIIYNMQVQIKVHVAPHTCAVGTYDLTEKFCRYEGLVSC